jgi:hypothetical protein
LALPVPLDGTFAYVLESQRLRKTRPAVRRYPQPPAPGNNRDAFGKRDGGSAPRRSCCTDGGSAKATYDGPGDWIARRCSHQSTAAGTDGSARERPVDGPVPTSRHCDCQCGNDGKVCGSQHAYLQVSGHLLNGPLNRR